MRTTTTTQTAAQRITAAHRNLIWARYRDLIEGTVRDFAKKRGLPGDYTDDLRQHATMALLRAADRIDPEINNGNPWPYLRRTIIGAMQQWLRDHAEMPGGTRRNPKRVKPLEHEVSCEQHTPEVPVDLGPILRQLPPEDRQIVELMFLENMSGQAIARHLAITARVVAERKQRALAVLRQLMRDPRTSLLG